jgi:hypothetical protein
VACAIVILLGLYPLPVAETRKILAPRPSDR